MLEKIISTPIIKLNYCDMENSFYMKRDDLLPLSFGGNKVRKGILFFHDIREKGANAIVTYGSNSSNHCRVIANLASAVKLPCHIISPEGDGEISNNSRIIKLLGADVTVCQLIEAKTTIESKMVELMAQGYIPYFIQGGGHGNIGTQAYIDAYNEIIDYEKAAGITFDYIFHASGTGTTQAGLICGSIVRGEYRNIIGISIARSNPYGSYVIKDSIIKYFNYFKDLDTNGEKANNNVFYSDLVLNQSIDIDGIEFERHISFIDDYILGGYGSYNQDIVNIIKTVLSVDGIPLDGTYTGKAFYGMTEFIKSNNIKNKNILFIHTGGMPLFFDLLTRTP